MNHSELIERGFKWLRNSKHCKVILKEWTGGPRETPDIIGFHKNRYSILVECKASKLDFLADAKKYFRKRSGYGMGRERYYLTPPKMVSVEELPTGWGLLEAHPNCIKVIHKSSEFQKTISSLYNENKLILHALWCVRCCTKQELGYYRYSEAVKRGEIVGKKK